MPTYRYVMIVIILTNIALFLKNTHFISYIDNVMLQKNFSSIQTVQDGEFSRCSNLLGRSKWKSLHRLAFIWSDQKSIHFYLSKTTPFFSKHNWHPVWILFIELRMPTWDYFVRSLEKYYSSKKLGYEGIASTYPTCVQKNVPC